MTRVTAVLPGYASVARASEVLHLAPRSVRDLIYSGRLPSLRVGRLHYIRSSDLDVERRRRLGLPLPQRRLRSRPRAEHPSIRPRVDPAVRRQRAAERAAIVARWSQRHRASELRVPFEVAAAADATACAACSRQIRPGGRLVEVHDGLPSQLCLTCGRRALLDWADHRRLEAAAARRLSQDLGAAPQSQVA